VLSCPKVCVIVLNWNQPEVTAACLDSVQSLQYPSFEIILVDNGSTDNSVQLIEKTFTGILVMKNQKNLGFAEGSNVGMRRAMQRGADYVFLLNNDTVVSSDALAILVGAAERDQQIGIAGPTIYYYGCGNEVWRIGGTIDRFGRARDLASVATHNDAPAHSRELDFVTGCAMLVKRTVVEHVGMIDPRFFAYYEELDWCMRAKRAGFSVLYVPGAKVWHKIAVDARSESPAVAYLMTRNRLLFLAKMGYAPPVILAHLAQMLFKEIKERGRLRRAVLKGVYDYFGGRFGAPMVT
jgi:GT2 family glycosyltransferase